MQPALLQYRAFGKTGFLASVAGFGGYRIDYRIAEHYEALVHAIRSGINLIDTSANYTDGGSELLIGKALRSVQESDGIRRDQLFLVSKFPLGRIENLPKIYGIDIFCCPGPFYFFQQRKNFLISFFLLKELKKGMAVKNEGSLVHPHCSFFLSRRSFSAREGLGGRIPQAAPMGSSTGGIR